MIFLWKHGLGKVLSICLATGWYDGWQELWALESICHAFTGYCQYCDLTKRILGTSFLLKVICQTTIRVTCKSAELFVPNKHVFGLRYIKLYTTLMSQNCISSKNNWQICAGALRFMDSVCLSQIITIMVVVN